MKMVHYYDAENDQLTWDWEWPDVITLVAGVPTATTITGFVGLTVNQYAGQMLVVCTGNQQDKTYWVISNTATILTVQGNGYTPTDATLGSIEATARLSVSTNGNRCSTNGSTITKVLGITRDGSLPEPEPEIKPHFGHGGGVKRITSTVPKIDYSSGRIPVKLQNPSILLGLGKVKSIGTEKAAGHFDDTLSAKVSMWDNQISVGAVVNLLVNDIITIDPAGSYPETREVTAINALILTLNVPLEHAHANAVVAHEVEAPYTITIEPADFLLRSFTMLHVFSDPNGVETDLIRTYCGNYLNSFNLSGVTDKENIGELNIMAMLDEFNPTGVTKPIEAPWVDGSSIAEEMWYWDNALVDRNGVTIAIPEESKITWNNKLKAFRGLAPRISTKKKRPYRIIRDAYADWKHDVKYRALDYTLLEDNRSPAEYDGYVQWERTRDSQTETMKFITYSGRAVGKWPMPQEGMVMGEYSDSPQYMKIEILSDAVIY